MTRIWMDRIWYLLRHFVFNLDKNVGKKLNRKSSDGPNTPICVILHNSLCVQRNGHFGFKSVHNMHTSVPFKKYCVLWLIFFNQAIIIQHAKQQWWLFSLLPTVTSPLLVFECNKGRKCPMHSVGCGNIVVFGRDVLFMSNIKFHHKIPPGKLFSDWLKNAGLWLFCKRFCWSHISYSDI